MIQLAAGRRRRILEDAFAKCWKRTSRDECSRSIPLPRTQLAGSGAQRRQSGRPVEIRDLQIAGIAAARKASIATRNVRGLTVIDPWSE